MTDEEVMKILDTAKTEKEMLALAKKLGVCNAFFESGKVHEVDDDNPHPNEYGPDDEEFEAHGRPASAHPGQEAPPQREA